jgi:mono/diheme cytochrome c family protein
LPGQTEEGRAQLRNSISNKPKLAKPHKNVPSRRFVVRKLPHTSEQNNAIDYKPFCKFNDFPSDKRRFHKAETRHQHCSLSGKGTSTFLVPSPREGIYMPLAIHNSTKLAASLLAFLLFGVLLLTWTPARAQGEATAVDATYKAKCAMCHGGNAEKSFDATKTDEVLLDAVLKGVKPKMPSYDQKLSPDQAKGLVGYMKSLKK